MSRLFAERYGPCAPVAGASEGLDAEFAHRTPIGLMGGHTADLDPFGP